MKRFQSIIAVLALASSMAVFFSCGKDNGETPEETAELTLGSASITLDAEACSKAITVTTNQPSYDISIGESWLSVEKEADRFTVSAEANTTSDKRGATITVTAGNAEPQTLKVTQKGVETNTSLEFNPTKLNVFEGNNAAPQTVEIITEATSWTAECLETWAQAKTDGNKVTITVTDNLSMGDRTGMLVVRSSELKDAKTLQFTQAAGWSSTVSFDPTGAWSVTYAKDFYYLKEGAWETAVTADTEVSGGFVSDKWVGITSSSALMPIAYDDKFSEGNLSFATNMTRIVATLSSSAGDTYECVSSIVCIKSFGDTSASLLSDGNTIPIYMSIDGTALYPITTLQLSDGEYYCAPGYSFTIEEGKGSYFGDTCPWGLKFTKSSTQATAIAPTYGNTATLPEPINMTSEQAARFSKIAFAELPKVTMTNTLR
jgi:hypothetical protein